ncbi:MAG TPA: patatin-like phospholipase family protein [candidate division Zixibacteria bacterium]|nr:patatin-like phospholipase family protein [candidate division Zixibacteria bacterium]
MAEKSDKGKLALFLSGGGARGAFQVGALKHLIGELGRKYEIVTGFSVGALNGSMVAQGDFNALYELWQGVDSPFDVISGNFMFYKGLLSMKPLRKIIEDYLDIEKLRASEIEFFFSAVDLQKGESVVLNKHSEPLIDWLMASSSIPGVFAPTEIDGRQFVDGGVLATKPLSPAIKAGAEEIDIILCAPLSDWSTQEKFDTILKTSVRSIELQQSEMISADIANCEQINQMLAKWRDVKGEANFVEGFVFERLERKKKLPLGKMRHVKLNIIEPPSDVISIFDFNGEKIKKAIDEGYKKALDLGLENRDI